MGELRRQLLAKNKAIADRWAARTEENLGHRLTAADIDFILGPLLKKGRPIADAEGEAIILILQSSMVEIDAVDRIRDLVTEAIDHGRWGIPQLTTPKDLAPIFQALGHDVVSPIIFKSPGTLITYSPSKYLAIKLLIMDNKIKVFQVKGGTRKIIDAVAHYNLATNALVLQTIDPAHADTRVSTIVHECTHAIQDWSDADALAKQEEADAYIAATIVTLRSGKQHIIKVLDDDWPSFTKAARCVLSGRAAANDQEWLAAYDDVVSTVEAIIPHPNSRSDHKGETINEMELFSNILCWTDGWETVRGWAVGR
jgi:hypothetical protein